MKTIKELAEQLLQVDTEYQAWPRAIENAESLLTDWVTELIGEDEITDWHALKRGGVGANAQQQLIGRNANRQELRQKAGLETK